MAIIQHAFSKAFAAGQATAAKRGVALSPIRDSIRNGSLRSSSTILTATRAPFLRHSSCLPVTSSAASSSRMLHAALPLSHTCSSSQALHGGQRRRMATVLSAAAPQTAQPVAEEDVDDRIPVTVRSGSLRRPWGY